MKIAVQYMAIIMFYLRIVSIVNMIRCMHLAALVPIKVGKEVWLIFFVVLLCELRKFVGFWFSFGLNLKLHTVPVTDSSDFLQIIPTYIAKWTFHKSLNAIMALPNNTNAFVTNFGTICFSDINGENEPASSLRPKKRYRFFREYSTAKILNWN